MSVCVCVGVVLFQRGMYIYIYMVVAFKPNCTDTVSLEASNGIRVRTKTQIVHDDYYNYLNVVEFEVVN